MTKKIYFENTNLKRSHLGRYLIFGSPKFTAQIYLFYPYLFMNITRITKSSEIKYKYMNHQCTYYS